jgi:hypothetical protein
MEGQKVGTAFWHSDPGLIELKIVSTLRLTQSGRQTATVNLKGI